MKSILKIIKEEIEDYKGEHQAPDANDSPMFDVINAFGEDMYTPEANRYFGNYRPYDSYSISLIQQARNKPNLPVKIYRAIPKTITNQEKIDNYNKQKKYILKYGKLPPEITIRANSSEYYDFISDEIDKLSKLPDNDVKVKINNGDWVTINPAYAKEHGESNIGRNKYRILTKTVKAKQLFTDGNDINEWGYADNINENLDDKNNSSNKTTFTEVPDNIFNQLKLRKFSDEANKSHMKIFLGKDGNKYLIKKTINQDIFNAYDLSNLQKPIATAVFDVHNDYFTGYEHNQSIKVDPSYRRLGLATAITDLAENIYNIPYKPTNLQTPEMQAFTKNRLGENRLDSDITDNKIININNHNNITNTDKNIILNEDFTNGQLYGYHCTPTKNLENIEQNGFNIGPRAMQGTGVYAFYNLQDDSSGNAAVGYGNRHLGNNFSIVKFIIKYPKWLLILIKTIADEVLNNNADIIKQIEEQFGDWNTYMNLIFRYISPEYRTQEFSEQHKIWMINQFNKNNDASSKELMFGDGYLGDVAKFGVIYYGEYGIEYLIKKPTIIQPIGYYNVNYVDGELVISEYIPFNNKTNKIVNIINNNDKYSPLKDYLPNIKNLEDLQIIKHKFDEKRYNVRNNREYDYYTNLIDMIDELVGLNNNINEIENGLDGHEINIDNTDNQSNSNNFNNNHINEIINNKKLYYHGRSKSRPYKGNYIFITDNLGYASGYSDGKELYTYTIPFDQNKIFSIKNSENINLLSKYIDKQSLDAIIRDSGPNQEIDWAVLSYITNDDYDQPEDLLEHLGFLGVRLKERSGIDSIYIFDENNLSHKGTIDITKPKMKSYIGKFYKDFEKDKNFL